MAKISRSKAIEACRLDLNYLARITKPMEFTSDFPPLFIAVFHLIIANLEKPEYWARYLIAIPRGHAKSTFLEVIIVWFLTFSKLQTVMIIGSTAGLAEDMLASVADMMQERDYILLFGDYRVQHGRDTTSLQEFHFQGLQRRIEAKGAGSKIRGKKRISRPQLYILDDLQVREDADNPELLRKLHTWLTTTVLMGRHNKRAIAIYCGNKYPTENCMVSKLEEAPHWSSVVMGAILADGKALWEEVRSLVSLLQEKADMEKEGMVESFISEMLNGKVKGLFSGINVSDIPEAGDKEATPVIGRFIIMDIATDKETADQCVIAQFDYHPDSLVVCKEVEVGKWAHDDLAERAVEMALRTQTPLICYEDVGYQHILNKEIQKSMDARGLINMYVMPVSPQGLKKNWRIQNWLFKRLLKGHLLLHPTVRAIVLNQVGLFNRMKATNLDDILDCLAYHNSVVHDPALVHLSLLPVNELLMEDDEDMQIGDNTAF